MTDLSLRAENICVTADGAVLVDDASFTLEPGAFAALLGPNGAGKTSLLRAALGLASPASGASYLGADSVAEMAPVERARRVAYLPQSRPMAWPLAVRDVVRLGRFAHGVPGQGSGGGAAADDAAVARALDACALDALAERSADTLSGGEAARMHLARAFAAETPLLVADEPTAALDPAHQHAVMALLKDFTRKGGGALAVLHDVDLAAQYCDRLIWMKAGRIVADGSVKETLSTERMTSIYGVEAAIEGGAPRVRIDGISRPPGLGDAP